MGACADQQFLSACAGAAGRRDGGAGGVVCVMTGSFNPPHVGHAALAAAAAEHLGDRFVGVVMVPSSDEYVERKVWGSGDRALPFGHRRELLLRLLSHAGVPAARAHVSDAEQAQRLFYFGAVRQLGDLCPDGVTAAYLCGGDRGEHIVRERCGWEGLGTPALLIAERAGARVPPRGQWHAPLTAPGAVAMLAAPDLPPELSSTALRAAAAAAAPGALVAALAPFLPPPAAEYYAEYCTERGAEAREAAESDAGHADPQLRDAPTTA